MTEYHFTDLRQGRQVHHPVDLGQEITRGGEGAIFHVQAISGVRDPGKYVAKIFLKDAEVRSDKIEAMVRHRPSRLTHAQPIRVAWPFASLFSGDQRVGFLMPYIDMSVYMPMYTLYNIGSRRQLPHNLNWQAMFHIGANLAAILQTLHEYGYVVGDLNDNNILVNKDLYVAMIDCDSMQVSRPGGGVFPCLVGMPQFLPPELQGVVFKEIEFRRPDQDCFGLAVLVYMLLMSGWHPYDGEWKGKDNAPLAGQRIKDHLWPYRKGGTPLIAPPKPPLAPSFDILPKPVQDLFRRTFDEDATKPEKRRPMGQEWHQVLTRERGRLKQCKKDALHWYHHDSCPWCERVRAGIVDFPRVTGRLSN